MENELINIFWNANQIFLENETKNIINKVSERNLCGRLAIYLDDNLRVSNFSGYYVDTEYNRNGGKIKTILDKNSCEIIINCDIVIHSRGENISQDNLIAFEMKKYNRPRDEKNSDRNRLELLTRDSYDGIWSADGETLPKHVCGYIWGVYIEIDSNKRTERIELYQKGHAVTEKLIKF